jgi:N-methylhydantoinase B
VSVRVQPGDRIFCLSAGGGGFGDPQDRPPDKRAWDVQNGYCSREEQA